MLIVQGITELLDCMQADSVNIMILSNKHSKPIEYDAKEKWFGTEYKRQGISINILIQSIDIFVSY